MRHLVAARTGLLIVLASLVPAPTVFAQGFDPSDIPYPLRSRYTDRVKRGHQAGSVNVNAYTKTITIYWDASAITNERPDWSLRPNLEFDAMGNHKFRGATQEIPVRFYPTECAAVGSDALVVSGVSESGSTIIEKWSLTWPIAMPAISPPDCDGYTHVEVVAPSVSQITRLYDNDVVGRRFVRNLCVLRTSAPEPTGLCLVHYDDSNDVYLMDMASRQQTLLASATDCTASLGIVAGLFGPDQIGISFGNHVTAGYVYTFSRGIGCVRAPPLSTDPPVVMLVDSDRNGEIDSVLQISTEDYQSQGWWNLENYIDWWLD